VDDALASGHPFEAYLWRHVVHYGAEAQPIFRSNWNYHPHTAFVSYINTDSKSWLWEAVPIVAPQVFVMFHVFVEP
jgi:hypothetical protein